jgi:integrase
LRTRRGELLGLLWEDVDLEGGVLTVRRSLQRVSGRTLLVEPKTARSRRTLQLPAFVVAAWRSHRARQAAERLAAGQRWQETGFVFTTVDGRPLDGMNVTHHFQRLLAKAGVRKCRFHDLRHSCATVLMAQGVPARVAMEILGHSQIGVTMNTYTHVLDELSRNAAGQMDAYLRGLADGDAATNAPN